MLSYFPSIYPSELLYSVLARYHRHVGSPGAAHILEALFGNRRVIATFDLPGHLEQLSERIPSKRGLSANWIIDNLTLFPYFTAFEPPHIRVKVRKAMQKGSIDGMHVRLGLAAFRVGRVQRLRFCSKCAEEMREKYGELYWRRDHQLPSVMVCPEHVCPLLQSKVLLTQHSRHEFIAATFENCPIHTRPVTSLMEGTDLSRLHQLACLSASLLNTLPEPRTFARWTNYYRKLMAETGLAKSPSTMDQKSFEEEFRHFYGATLELLPNIIEQGDFPSNWLAAMVRKHRKAFHPLQHLLVQNFLTHRDKQLSPFGKGPWPCRNPLAKHHTDKPIKNFTQHRNHNKLVAVFSCTCGYVYTRNFDPLTGKLGLPHFLRFGPLLESALRKFIEEGLGLRQIGRVLNLDPKTVVRECGNLGIYIPWALKPSGRIRSQDNIALSEKSEVMLGCDSKEKFVSRKSVTKLRHDWKKIDRTWVAKLKKTFTEALNEYPPVRITVAELERRNGKRGWLLKRRHRMPKTMAYLDCVVESTEGFQLRRIRWAISELEMGGLSVKAWRVMRKAGLHSDKRNWVEHVIEEHLNVLRFAA